VPFPALLSLLLGAIAALGFAPLELWPLTLVGLAGWLLLVHAAPSGRAALWRGWLFGLGHFTVNNNWFQHAFDFQDVMPPVLGYFAAVALALYLAVYPALAALIAWRVRSERPDLAFALAAGAAWISTEWLRAVVFTGYAWNPIGVIWVPVQPVAALSAWIGTYALSGLTVVAAALIAAMPLRPWPIVAALVALDALLVAQGFSYRTPPPSAARPELLVHVVQPNVGQDQRDATDAERTLRAQIARTAPPGPVPRLILWPEGMVRDFIDFGYPAWIYDGRYPHRIRDRLRSVLGPRDLLVVGDTPLRFDATGEVVGASNSLTVLDARGRTVARYDKAHLVPYGEYLPMPWLLRPLGLARLVPGDLDFAPGPGPRSIDLPGVGPVGFQTCYEIIFSGQVIDPKRRPRLLLNPSNDAWFGKWGPPQHLAQARMRAIEEGLPIVRATPTGISAVIAADGALLASVPHERAGNITLPLPEAKPPTLFSRIGNWAALIVAVLLALGAVAIRRRRR
jgi:apolipoprotein N-acyltransferase